MTAVNQRWRLGSDGCGRSNLGTNRFLLVTRLPRAVEAVNVRPS